MTPIDPSQIPSELKEPVMSAGQPADQIEGLRCRECNMPLTMHHDPMCSQPCKACDIARPKQVASLLDEAADILNRTSRRYFNYTAMHWVNVRDTLRDVAEAYRRGDVEVDQ